MGGRYGDDTLVVAVQAPAVNGRATKEAVKALAEALGYRPADVALVSGATSRTKVVEVPDAAQARVEELLGV